MCFLGRPFPLKELLAKHLCSLQPSSSRLISQLSPILSPPARILPFLPSPAPNVVMLTPASGVGELSSHLLLIIAELAQVSHPAKRSPLLCPMQVTSYCLPRRKGGGTTVK